MLREIRRFFEDYKVLEHKQVVVEDLLGPPDALRLIREALVLYQQLRRGELKTRVSLGQFATSLLLGFLSILLPLLIFISMVAACVYIARWWIERNAGQ